MLAFHRDGPLFGGVIVGSALALGGTPVVELHDLRITFQPVGDLVLRGEHRPVVGELDVGQMVVPDRVVKTERLVAIAPRVPGARVFLDDDGGNAQHAHAGPEGDAALSTANDDGVGLIGVAEGGRFVGFGFQPTLSARHHAVLHPSLPVVTVWFFVSLQLHQRSEQREALVSEQANLPVAPADCGFEVEPAVGDTSRFVGLTNQMKARRSGLGKAMLKHVAHTGVAFDRHNIPGERHQIAPVALGREHRDGGVDVARFEGVTELGQPSGKGGGW